MGNVRVFQLARDLNLQSQEVIDRLKKLGVDVKTASSSVDGVHLDENQHRSLGLALVDFVGQVLKRVPNLPLQRPGCAGR